jgi:hypothetical protein
MTLSLEHHRVRLPLQALVLAFEPLHLARCHDLLATLRPALAATQPGQLAALARLLPLGQMRRVEPFPAQQRAHLPGIGECLRAGPAVTRSPVRAVLHVQISPPGVVEQQPGRPAVVRPVV